MSLLTLLNCFLFSVFPGTCKHNTGCRFLKVMPVILAVKPLWEIPLFTLITIFVSFVRYHNRDAGISMFSTAAGISTIPSLAVNKARSISILTVLLGAQHCFAFNVSLSGCCWGSTPHRCGDGPTKTIFLCDKATLIPLFETCKVGPPTVSVSQRETFISVCSTYSQCVCAHIVLLHICE